MKTLMTCDTAFEALTSGPIELAAATSAELSEHLKSCDSCRELATALRPASHLLHEALPSREQAGLPVVLAAEDLAVTQIMDQIHAHARVAPKASWRRPTAFGLATVAGVILVLMGPWWSQGREAADSDFRQELDSLRLPSQCFQMTADAPIGATADCQSCHGPMNRPSQASCALNLLCCTSCHAATGASNTTGRVDVTRLVAACGACHHQRTR